MLLRRIIVRATLAGILAGCLLAFFVAPSVRDASEGRSAAMRVLSEALIWLIAVAIGFLEGFRTWRSAHVPRPTSPVPSVLIGAIIGTFLALCVIGILLGEFVEDWSQPHHPVPIAVQIRIVLAVVGAAILGGIAGYRKAHRNK